MPEHSSLSSSPLLPPSLPSSPLASLRRSGIERLTYHLKTDNSTVWATYEWIQSKIKQHIKMTYFNSPSALATFNYIFQWPVFHVLQLKSYLRFKAYYFSFITPVCESVSRGAAPPLAFVSCFLSL